MQVIKLYDGGICLTKDVKCKSNEDYWKYDNKIYLVNLRKQVVESDQLSLDKYLIECEERVKDHLKRIPKYAELMSILPKIKTCYDFYVNGDDTIFKNIENFYGKEKTIEFLLREYLYIQICKTCNVIYRKALHKLEWLILHPSNCDYILPKEPVVDTSDPHIKYCGNFCSNLWKYSDTRFPEDIIMLGMGHKIISYKHYGIIKVWKK